MSHKFNADNKHKLISEERKHLLPPYETLKKMGLEPGYTMADIGCGVGYFTLPAADILSETGSVLAVDISQDMINHLEKKISENNISNVTPIKSDENDFKLADGSVSFAFVSNVVHEADNIKAFLEEVSRILMNRGEIAIIEWSSENIYPDYGPPLDHRLASKDLEWLLKKTGFKNIQVKDLGQYFYGVLAELD